MASKYLQLKSNENIPEHDAFIDIHNKNLGEIYNQFNEWFFSKLARKINTYISECIHSNETKSCDIICSIKISNDIVNKYHLKKLNLVKPTKFNNRYIFIF
jgi:hypothetical protein